MGTECLNTSFPGPNYPDKSEDYPGTSGIRAKAKKKLNTYFLAEADLALKEGCGYN